MSSPAGADYGVTKWLPAGGVPDGAGSVVACMGWAPHASGLLDHLPRRATRKTVVVGFVVGVGGADLELQPAASLLAVHS